MGAYGAGSFENDGAGILLDDLLSGDNLLPIQEAFKTVLENDGYIDVDDAQIAVAACEVTAILRGAPGTDIPEMLLEWHQQYPVQVEDALTAQAIRAAQKVYAGSELRELWEEGSSFPRWHAAVLDLIRRLEAPNSG